MTQVYSDPSRESEPTALPNVEVWYHWPDSNPRIAEDDVMRDQDPGWYYWFCLPGCLPDSDPIGPFDSEQEAIADAQDY